MTHSLVKDSALFSVVKVLVADLATLKLGVPAQTDDLSMPAVEDELSQRGEALVKVASKMFGGNLQKLVGPGVVWVKAHLQKLPALEAGSAADEALVDFVPGTLVLTTSGAHKHKLDQKKGAVVKGGCHQLVKLLEGEAMGTTKTFFERQVGIVGRELSKGTDTLGSSGRRWSCCTSTGSQGF